MRLNLSIPQYLMLLQNQITSRRTVMSTLSHVSLLTVITIVFLAKCDTKYNNKGNDTCT